MSTHMLLSTRWKHAWLSPLHDVFGHLKQNLGALRIIVLDEVSFLPEGIEMMDASGAYDTRNLGVDESTETALTLRACDSTMSRTVVVQKYVGKLRRATVIASSPAT